MMIDLLLVCKQHMLSSSQCPAQMHKVDGFHIHIFAFTVSLILVKRLKG